MKKDVKNDRVDYVGGDRQRQKEFMKGCWLAVKPRERERERGV